MLSIFVGTSCPSCVHMSYSVSGLPPMIQSMMDSMLSQTGLENSACLEGTSDVAEICQAHSLPGFVVNKCQTTEVTVNAKGLAYFAGIFLSIIYWIHFLFKINNNNMCISFVKVRITYHRLAFVLPNISIESCYQPFFLCSVSLSITLLTWVPSCKSNCVNGVFEETNKH